MTKVQELIDAYEAYIKLLNEEIQGMPVVCYIHGWESSLVEQGIQARERISRVLNNIKNTRTGEDL
jgi:hypothetical protein